MTFTVLYFSQCRWRLGGVFTDRQRMLAFCEWLASDGIRFTIKECNNG